MLYRKMKKPETYKANLNPALPFPVESTGLGAVAAVLHVAPAPALVAADIQKEPPAGRIGAGFDFLQLIGYQQLGRGTNNRVEQPVHLAFVAS